MLLLILSNQQSVAQCTQPNAKSSTVPPATFTHETIANGEWTSPSTWKNGSVPSLQPSGRRIKITHTVHVNNGNVSLKSASILYVYGGSFTLKNGNFELLDGTGEKFLAENSTIRFSGNANQKANTVFYAKNVDLQIGDKGTSTGSPLFSTGGTTTSANFQNDGGYRRLEDVCMVVTHDYDNIGEDELINVCADIGLRNPLNESNPVGQGSGNISNYSGSTSMKVYGSQFFIPNGNVVNSKTLLTCNSRYKLTNGNFQNQSSSTWSGQNLCIWVTGNSNHDLQNSGTWTVGVSGLCINGQIQGTFQTRLPAENCGTIQNCFNSTPCCNPALPVSWLGIKAIKNDNGGVDINWATASELNNDFFTIEKSLDNRNFSRIGVLKGSGTKNTTTHYAFEDYNPGALTVYYRIKQTDFNGEYEYSSVVVVNPSKPINNVTFQPNPAKNNVNLKWESTTNDQMTIQLSDLSGAVILSEVMPLEGNTFNLNIQNINNGIYMINIVSKGKMIYRSKIIVAK